MEDTSDKDDEPTTMSQRQRRSSILKIPKNRNPFEEIDESFEDNGASRSTRRVSFASSNFIKPFAADPDKNTIWDTTYEEEINHTDSTHSSQEQGLKSCSKVESTFFNSTKNVLISDMEITNAGNPNAVSFHGNENVPPIEKVVSIIDYTKKVNSVSPLYSLKCNRTDLTQLHPQTMEFTCILPQTEFHSKNNIEELAQTKSSNMELTCQFPTSNLRQDEQAEDVPLSDMELSCQVSTSVLNQSRYEKEPLNTDDPLTCDIEGTHPVPILNFNQSLYKKETPTIQESLIPRQVPTSHLDQSLYENKHVKSEEVSDSYMEFTCQFSKSHLNQSLCKMEFLEAEETGKNDIKITEPVIVDKTVLTNAELVCKGSNNEISQLENMEFTCQFPKTFPDNSGNLGSHFGGNKENINGNIETDLKVVSDRLNTDANNEQSMQNPGRDISKPDNYQFKLSENNISHGEERLADLTPNQMSISETCSMEISYAESFANSAKSIPLKSSKIPIKSTKHLIDKSVFLENKHSSEDTVTNSNYVTEDWTHIPNIKSDGDKREESMTTGELLLTCMPSPMSRADISSSVDDTEQLLHYSYKKTALDFTNTHQLLNDDISLMLKKEETVNNVTLPTSTSMCEGNLNNTEIDDVRLVTTLSDVSNDFEENKLTAVNDTYFLKNKHIQMKEGKQDVMSGEIVVDQKLECDTSNDSSLGIVDIPQLDDMAKINHEEHKKTKWFDNLSVKKYNIKIKTTSDLKPLIKKIQKRDAEIREYLENFKVKPINIPKQFKMSEELQKEIKEQRAQIQDSIVECVELNLEQKIKLHQESSGNSWILESVNGNFYMFSTLFGTLVFTVEVDPTTGTVFNMKISNELAGDSQPIALYIMKLFLDKLDSGHLASAIGKSFDILTLLDYVQMTMVDLYDLQTELVLCHILTLDKNFIATFKIISTRARILGEVSINVADIDHIDLDSVKVTSNIGTIHEKEFKNLAKKCRKGIHFFEEFVSCIEAYIKVKEKKKGGFEIVF